MAHDDYLTIWLSLWREWNKANLRMCNPILRGWADPYQGSTIFSEWLKLSVSGLRAWNRLLVPWMGTQAFSEAMETSLAMSRALGQIGQAATGEALPRRDRHTCNERMGTVLPLGVGQTPRTLV
ncbi:MAG TPA: hypothetical protein VFB12_11620 [Ktedonobacteraceae bacterium]|nr:hypothetical protein [Ktedonobacteraceae bacterium]